MITARTWLATAALCTAALTATAGDVPADTVKFQDGEVQQSLSGAPGAAAEGRKYFADRSLGNCLACHANSEMSEQLFHGEVGPTLDGVAERWTPAQLRAIIANSKAVFGPETVMPGFYTLEVGANVRKDLVGKTILTAQQVEDIVAYLTTLK